GRTLPPGRGQRFAGAASAGPRGSSTPHRRGDAVAVSAGNRGDAVADPGGDRARGDVQRRAGGGPLAAGAGLADRQPSRRRRLDGDGLAGHHGGGGAERLPGGRGAAGAGGTARAVGAARPMTVARFGVGSRTHHSGTPPRASPRTDRETPPGSV